MTYGIVGARAHGPSGSGFFQLKAGGGGLVTGISIATDNTKYIKTDANGGFYYNPSTPNIGNAGGTGSWQQVMNTVSLAGIGALPSSAGTDACYEIVAAPSLSSTVFAAYDTKVFSSANNGSTWADLSFPAALPRANEGGLRGSGPHIAVDPVNPAKLFVGSPGTGGTNGVYYSTNSGGAWNLISSGTIPQASGGPGIYSIAYDASSSTGGSTPTAYVGIYGMGVYKTTSGTGSSGWSSIAGPTQIFRIKVDLAGVLWAADGSTGIWRYKSGAWVNVSAGTAVMISKTNQNQVWVSNGSGLISYSSSAGDSGTFSGPSANPNLRVATDVPWLAVTEENSLAPSDIEMDSNGLAYLCEGIGIWTFTPPTASITSTTVTMNSLNSGIEELVGYRAVCPPGGSGVLLGCWDRPGFYRAKSALDTYPTTLIFGSNLGFAIVGSWAFDWAQPTPTTVGMIAASNIGNSNDFSGLSTDGGQTFTPFGAAVTGTASVADATVSFTGAPTGLDLWPGDRISFFSASNIHNYRLDAVATYNSATGAITTNSAIGNTGTGTGITDWKIHTIPRKNLRNYMRAHGTANANAASVSFTITGKSWSGGDLLTINVSDTVVFRRVQDRTVTWTGTVSAYNSTTGVLAANRTSNTGSATGATDWELYTLNGTEYAFQHSFSAGFAMSSTTNLIWKVGIGQGGPSNAPYYTTDGGIHWIDTADYFFTNFSLTSMDPAWNTFQGVCADRTTTNKFYMQLTGSTAPGGYVTTDGGATWTRKTTTNLGTSTMMKSVIGQSGHVFMCQYGGLMYRTQDGLATDWVQVANVSNCCGFDTGAIVPGQSYPAIYFNGAYSGVWGIWQSIDNCVSFQKLIDYPVNNAALPQDLGADPDIPGQIYIAYSGAATGWSYRKP